MKKFLSVLLVAMVTVMTMAVSVSAASTESDIITALKSAGVPDTYVATAESYLAQSDVVLTSAQVDSVIADIKDAAAITGGAKFSAVTADQKLAVIDEVTSAAKTLGLSTTFSSTAGLSITDSTGKVLITVNSDSAAVKQTGFDYSIVFIGLAVIGLAGISAVAAKKVIRRRELKLAAECE